VLTEQTVLVDGAKCSLPLVDGAVLVDGARARGCNDRRRPGPEEASRRLLEEAGLERQ
jgi:hypothetical protein